MSWICICQWQRSPPSVAEIKMCVPYFLMMVSMNCCVDGRRPSIRMLRWKSGIKGRGLWIRSRLSMAVFLTFQRANSLQNGTEQTVRPVMYSCICTRISTVLSNTPTVTTKVHWNSSHSVFFLLLVKTHYRIQKLLSLEEVTIAT